MAEEKSEKEENSSEKNNKDSDQQSSSENKNNKDPDSNDSGKENKQNDKSGGEEGEEISIFEWIAAGLGCILVFGSIFFMTYKAFTARDIPPDLTATVKKVEKVKSGYLVRFEVKNNGESAASAAVIKGELFEGDKTKETSTTTVDYVPSFSTRSGGIFFTKNPKDYRLSIRATGYSEP